MHQPAVPSSSLSTPSSVLSESKTGKAAIGQLGETLVAQWLQAQGWQILARGWHSRWGELDLVAQLPGQTASASILAFVEVKTRSRGNWDADGLLSITIAKQKKLWKTARCFLSHHPRLAELPCRFDIALVACRRPPQSLSPSGDLTGTPPTHLIQMGQPMRLGEYWLTLQEYLPSAFDGIG